jgi:protein ImuB
MVRGVQSLDLFVPEPVEARGDERHSLRDKPQLWVAVSLPRLALESLAAERVPGPAVVVEAQQGQVCVVTSNREAAKAGIHSGTRLGTATTLAASLQIFEREPQRERASLESLARWAQGLTSMVSIESSEAVLLEVAGSLMLFGGLEAIKAKLSAELSRRSLDFRLCAAPTATAALWLARAASTDVLLWHELAGRLGALPLGATGWPLTVQALLRDLGARTIGDCARLPRDGFARRVGERYLHDLDRAYGRCFDLRAEFTAPDAWGARVELGGESVDGAVFLEAIEQLVDELTAELRRRQAQVGSLQVAFEHLHRPPTVESFDLLEPTHERGRLLRLVEDRLERRTLPVPAIAVQVDSGVLLPLTQREPDLFEKQPIEELVRALLERLEGRFGSAAVYGLRAVPEHRPEKAWAKWAARDGGRARCDAALPESPTRPLWLLPEPLSLPSVEARRAPLTLCSGPERIESGWWDEQDVGRDYYIATNALGQKLWIFRDRRTHSWYLHGLFG